MANQYRCLKCKKIVVVPSSMVFTARQSQQISEEKCADCLDECTPSKQGRF